MEAEVTTRPSTERSLGDVDAGRKAFMEMYGGRPPTHLSRAPGRVNLMGEHTDYNGLPVFPMALAQEVRIFFRPGSNHRVRIGNLNAEFQPRSFELSTDIPREELPGDWGNYLKAPCQALVRRLGLARGFDALVQSTLPVASGLSSSSALVNAVGLALLQVNGESLPALEMADEMAGAERYTGTRGGGMDQAISLGARAGHAARIEFGPLAMFHSRVPRNWHFLVAHSLVRAEKSGGAREAYNRRRAECGAALAMMAHSLGTRGEAPASFPTLVKRFPRPALLDRAADILPRTLFKRFRHVVTEACRVHEAQEAMEGSDLLTFGLLMDDSHESLRVDYDVSSPELDRLVELARGAGASGARLTGAGFGGCVVALVSPSRLDRVLGILRDGYYRDRTFPGPLSRVLFVAEASEGAGIQAL